MLYCPNRGTPDSPDSPLPTTRCRRAQAVASRARSSAGVRTGTGEPAKSLGLRVTMASRRASAAQAMCRLSSKSEPGKCDVQVEQDEHQPYFSVRHSSIHRSTVSSSGGGRSVLSKPWTSAADSPRVFAGGSGAGPSASSRDSRIFRASVIRSVVGQALTRFSTSVSSVASAVLMGQFPLRRIEIGRFVDPDVLAAFKSSLPN